MSIQLASNIPTLRVNLEPCICIHRLHILIVYPQTYFFASVLRSPENDQLAGLSFTTSGNKPLIYVHAFVMRWSLRFVQTYKTNNAKLVALVMYHARQIAMNVACLNPDQY